MTATRSTRRASDRGSGRGSSRNSPGRALRGEVLGDDRARRFEAFERRFTLVSRVLDDAIAVPGTRLRVGLDPLLGLVPILGDAVSGAIGFWLIVEASRFGVPRVVLARMVLNSGVDLVLGALPLVGDIFDIVSRSNARNLALFRRHALEPGASTRGDSAILIGLLLVVVGVLWLVAMAIGWLLTIRIPAP